MLTYGIEIEAILPATVGLPECANVIDAIGVPCYYAGYSHDVQRVKWKVVTDGSLSSGPGGGNPVEIVSPILTDVTLDQVTKVCEALQGLGARINRSCGLHVHIGAQHLSVGAMKKLAELYIENEEVIDGLLPPSRRGNANTYLQSVKDRTSLPALAAATTVAQIAAAVGNSQRYVKLNFTPYWRQGTVEFRHHSGTIDPVKILRWVGFCSKLIAAAERDQRVPVALPAGSPPVYSGYWRSGRRTRAIFELLSRPEGATAEELRSRLNVRSRPNIRWHLERAGMPGVQSTSRRGGFAVFKLTGTETVAVTRAEPATLDGLLVKLEMNTEETAFWKERAALVTPEVGPTAVMSNTYRRDLARGRGGLR